MKTILVVVFCTLLAIGVSWAGGSDAWRWAGIPVTVVCAVWALALNWLAFVPSSLAQTEKYYDLTGSFTYLSAVAIAVSLVPSLDLRAKLAAAMVIIWALRLGTFLFARIRRDGKDDRFDVIKTKPGRFFVAWTLQGLWVVLTAACALTILTDQAPRVMGLLGWLGVAIWLFGFVVEVIADRQKSQFKSNPDNRGKFIHTGLWSWSRHPNYFGEMVLWAGMAVLALPILNGWQWTVLISPVFVFVLINYISGVNKLEAKAEKLWGQDADYLAYKARTSSLLLWPPKTGV